MWKASLERIKQKIANMQNAKTKRIKEKKKNKNNTNCNMWSYFDCVLKINIKI